MLSIKNLQARIEEDDKAILKGLDLEVRPGEVHAIMGPNGSGKSTLGHVLAGRPGYEVTGGSISFMDRDLLEMETEERAREGLFLAFQYPVEIPGVSNMEFLKAGVDAVREHRGLPALDSVSFLKMQMMLLEPRLAILDETDSGLDIDALQLVARGVNALRGADRSIIMITHYQRLLTYIEPDFVHVLAGGRIVKSGDKSLALELEEKGYGWLENEVA